MGIYIASKCRHAPRWRELRKEGYKILSTWIDEAEVSESQSLSDLWSRCIQESVMCQALILYVEAGETMKGGLVEVGAALAGGVPVYVVGPSSALQGYSFLNHPLITQCTNLEEALLLAKHRQI